MATYFPETIGSLLKAKLDEVVTDGDLAVAYDAEVAELQKYPCATLTFLGFDDEIHDTAANVRVLHYLVRVYAKNQDKATAEADLRHAVGAVVNKIEADPTLGDNALFAVCRRADTEARTREMEVLFMNIEVDVAIRVNR